MDITKQWVESVNKHFNIWLMIYAFFWLGIGIIIGLFFKLNR